MYFLIIYFLFQTLFLVPFLEKIFKNKLQKDLNGLVQFLILTFCSFLVCFFLGMGDSKEYCGVTYDYNWDNDYKCIPYTEKEIMDNRIFESIGVAIGLVVFSGIAYSLLCELPIVYNYHKKKSSNNK